MPAYEYQVVPAPVRGEKAKGLKTTGERFANTLTGVLNDMAAQGWEYLRAETLPAEERSGLTGRNTAWQNLLVFRRAIGGEDAVTAKPARAAAPAAPAPVATAPAAPAPASATPAAPASAQAGTIPPAPRPMPDPKPAPRPTGNTPFSGRMPQPPLKPGEGNKP